jgi:predicted GIY-YIG superfamily endonuclease
MTTTEGMALPPEMLATVERYAVYRCYSDSGQLLYVGVTGRVGRRLGDHIQKAWFTQVRGMTFEWYAEELDALNAERRAIHVEHPQYNVVHRNSRMLTPGPSRPKSTRRKRGGKQVPPMAIEERARLALAANPALTGSALARELGVSEGYGRKLRRRLDRMEDRP